MSEIENLKELRVKYLNGNRVEVEVLRSGVFEVWCGTTSGIRSVSLANPRILLSLRSPSSDFSPKSFLPSPKKVARKVVPHKDYL